MSPKQKGYFTAKKNIRKENHKHSHTVYCSEMMESKSKIIVEPHFSETGHIVARSFDKVTNRNSRIFEALKWYDFRHTTMLC